MDQYEKRINRAMYEDGIGVRGTTAQGLGSNLTARQTQHVQDLITKFASLLVPKYTKGAMEHGGYIGDQTMLQLVDNAIEESIDQYVFLQTLKEKLTSPAPDNGYPQRRWFEGQDRDMSLRTIHTILCDAHEALSHFAKTDAQQRMDKAKVDTRSAQVDKGRGL